MPTVKLVAGVRCASVRIAGITSRSFDPCELAVGGRANAPGHPSVRPSNTPLPAPSVARVFEASSDRMLTAEVFQKVQSALGVTFTVDGACNPSGDNSHVPSKFYSTEHPFQSARIRGETLWLNAPFEQLSEMLEHYRAEKLVDPYNTSGCFVVPRRGIPVGKRLLFKNI